MSDHPRKNLILNIRSKYPSPLHKKQPTSSMGGGKSLLLLVKK